MRAYISFVPMEFDVPPEHATDWETARNWIDNQQWHPVIDVIERAADLLPNVTSLSDLRARAEIDDRYARLAMMVARDNGWPVPTTEAPYLYREALQWLEINLTEDKLLAETSLCRTWV